MWLKNVVLTRKRIRIPPPRIQGMVNEQQIALLKMHIADQRHLLERGMGELGTGVLLPSLQGGATPVNIDSRGTIP